MNLRTGPGGKGAFAPGETVKTVTIAINDDDTPELDEIFVVTLSNPTGGAVLGGPNTAVVRISANDSDDVTGPQVTRIGLTGPSRGITGAVVHFNEDLDPATAQNPDNYTLTGTGLRGGSQRLKFSSAVYDLATRTVTLQAAQPFIQTQFRQFDFRVNGKRGGVTDAVGNLLDGNERGKSGGDATLKFKVFTGLTVSITDRDGDQATLVLDVGGSIDGILPIKAPKTQLIQFWLLDVISLESTLTGTIKKGPKGNGIIVIAEIIGIDKKEFKPTTLLRGFVFNTITHRPIAGGR